MEIKHCPFCGSTSYDYTPSDVICCQCYAHGPSAEGEPKTQFELWNTRAAPEPQAPTEASINGIQYWIDKWDKAEKEWAAEKVRADTLEAHTAAKDERIAELEDALTQLLDAWKRKAAGFGLGYETERAIEEHASNALAAYRQQRGAGE